MERTHMDGFLEQLEEDATLRQAFVEFAAQHGFTSIAEELSDEDLDNVAGGIDTVPLPERTAFKSRLGVRGIIDINTDRNVQGIIDTNT